MTQARNEAVGAYGERVAAAHLRAQGMAVLSTNWRCKYGEVDIVARDGNTLVICEVKTRTSTDYGDPLEAIDQRKADRLRRLGARWLLAHDCHPDDIRIDLVGVQAPRGRPVEVEHVEGVG